MQFSHVGWQMFVKNVDFMANFTISRTPIRDSLSAAKKRHEKTENTNDGVALRIISHRDVLLRAHLFSN